MKGPTLRREKRARRRGWTPGPGIVLADGQTWYLPRLDDGLIPYLPMLAHTAKDLAEYEDMAEDDPACIFDPSREMASTYRFMLACDLHKIQYRTRPRTVADLNRFEGWPGWLRPLDEYHRDFVRFVRGRYPVGSAATLILATMN